MKKRLLAMLMALALLVSLMPMGVLADGPDVTADNTLTPEDKYYSFNGQEATAGNSNITLSKTAVDNGDGTYTITLTAEADKVVMAKSTEVVFVIDGSGSMNYCTESNPKHRHWNGNQCQVTQNDYSKSRWSIAINAIETMIDNLGEEGVTYKFVVYKDNYYGNAATYNTLDAVKRITPSGGTYLSAGVDEALDAFSDQDTNKVMIIVADGDSDDGYPSDSRYGYRTEFGEFKDNGGKVYTVGFTFSSSEFNAISSGEGYHFDATDADELRLSMEQISENIKGLISDPLGNDVELVSDVTVSGTNIPATVTGSTINWTDANGLSDPVTLTYTVKVKDEAVQAGENTVYLNGNATLNYQYNHNYKEVDFPRPYDTFSAATLTVMYVDESGRTIDNVTNAIPDKWVKLPSNGFGVTFPEIGDAITAGGQTYYVKSISEIPEGNLNAEAYEVVVTLSENEVETSQDGSDIAVKVYVNDREVTNDAELIGVSNWANRTDNFSYATKQDGTGDFNIDFTYTEFDSADFQITNNSNYALQAITATLIAGSSGSEGIAESGSVYSLDNVKGGTVVEVYLYTKYNVVYNVNGTPSTTITDGNTYISGSMPESGAVPGNGGKDAVVTETFGTYSTSITVEALPENTATETFSGWWLNDSSCTGTTTYGKDETVDAKTAIAEITDTTINFYAKSTANTATITINFVDEEETPNELKEEYQTTQAINSAYSYSPSSEDNAIVPMSITREGQKYVFDHFEGTPSGTLTDDIEITAVYSLDDNNNDVPDKYEVTVTYEVENGTWSDGTDTARNHNFAIKKFDPTTNTWIDDPKSLGDTVPTAQPDSTHVAPGAWYTGTTGDYTEVSISANTPVERDITYTYRFTTSATYELSIDKTVSGMTGETVDGVQKAKAGDTLTYTITVKNLGNTERTNVEITDTFMVGDTAAELTFDDNVTVSNNSDGSYTITVSSLGASGSDSDTAIITATYTVKNDDVGKTITNTAVIVDGDNPDDDPKDETETEVENPDIDITKTASVNGHTLTAGETVEVGDVITYTITVKNDGNVAFENLKVSDDMWGEDVEVEVKIGDVFYPANLAGNETDGYFLYIADEINHPGEFKPGETWTCRYTYKVVDTDAGETITNTAVVDGETDGEDTVEITVNDPSVSINKEVTGYNDKAMEGDELTYTITVRNTGNTKLDVTVSDDMWTYGKVSSAELDGVGIDVTSGKYTIFGLDAGESKAITYTYTVTAQDVANGKIDNAATADINNDGIPDDKHEVTTPTGDPSLTVEKTADASTVQVGTPITYTVEVKNDGYSVMNNVVISDTLWTSDTAIEAIGDVTGEYDTGESKYYIGKLEPGEYVTLTYTYTPTEAGGLENKVTVTSDDLDTVPEDSVIVDVTPEPTPDEPGISVTKTVSDRTPDVGDTITYYITVKNTGNTVIDEFTVKDSMWEYGMPIYVDGEPAYVNSDDAYTVKTADLEPGSSITISYAYRVRYADEGDRIVNTAAVTTPGEGPSDMDSVTIRVDDYWTPSVPDDDDDETVYVPNWLNTADHFAYLIGYEDGEIKPENNITRAEVATIFFRLLTDDARARFWSSENDYTDVATDSWYNNAVSTLSNMGIINGYDDGTFQPNASITRAEFTAIATRFFDYTAEYDGAFNDVASGSWYADYVQAAVDMGLVDGYPDGGFHPNSYITRAEAVTIVNRVLNRVPHEDYLLSTRVMNTWPDNVYGAWYYADMQEATNSHDYDWIRVSGERVEEWTEKLTERDWAALEQEWSTAYSG